MGTVGWRGLLLAAAVALTIGFLASSGCGPSGNKSGGSAGGTPPATAGTSLQLEIQSVQVPQTGTATVTFRATDGSGQAVDLLQEIRNAGAGAYPRTSAPRFTLAELQPDGTYLSAYERSITGKPYQLTDGGPEQPPALAATPQAVADPVPAADPDLGNRLTAQGDGVYTFQLSAPARTDLDRTRTWTVAMWATRTLSATDGGHPASAALPFVPDGGMAQGWHVVIDAACNTCHGRLEAHDRRTGVALCVTCHSPQTTDPESGNNVDLAVMVHRIHRGAGLPSVANPPGIPYRIVGFAPNNPAVLPPSAVQDYSEVTFPRAIVDCTACHQGADADRWKSAASYRACNSCHDNVRFDVSAPARCASGAPDLAPCNHTAGEVPGAPTANCAGCHTAEAVAGHHVNQLAGWASRFRYELVSATVDANRQPVVQFRVVDPTSGDAPYDIKTDPAFTAAGGASSLTVDVAWPTTEYSNAGSSRPYGQPIAMNALTTATAVDGQPGVFQVTTQPGQGGAPAATVPAGVDAITVVIEGHPAQGTQRLPVTSLVQDVALGGGTPPARRVVVETAKCNACHGQLSAHGSNRNGDVRACQVCHNPEATDKGRRTAAAPPVAGEESVDFKVLIHEVHGVGVRTSDVTIIGFGGNPNVFPIGLPFTGDCAKCHVGTSYAIPLDAAVVRDTTVDSGADPQGPDDNLRRPKNQAVCLACHDNATIHVAQYTSDGVERCQECHAAGGTVDVAKVHPITPAAQTIRR
ncbi:MAG: OmcA/MtrC family decaheme c-type cytochrome [Anaeromyxobacter sp.]